MNHLKKFNEELNQEEQDSLEKAFQKAKISPQTEKMNIRSIYRVLFIQVDDYVENVNGNGKYMMILFTYVCNKISVHETLDDAVENLTTYVKWAFSTDSWEEFKAEMGNTFVSVLEYNDTNFQEIENILIDYNINVENIWGVIK
jgi:hypothetical protein